MRVWLENVNLGVFLDATVDQMQNKARLREACNDETGGDCLLVWSGPFICVLSSDSTEENLDVGRRSSLLVNFRFLFLWRGLCIRIFAV